MEFLGTVVREGVWLFGGRIVSGVRIRRSETYQDLGEADDEPPMPPGPDGAYYYVEWDSSAASLTATTMGPFPTQADAERYALERTDGTLRWSPAAPLPLPSG